MSLNNKASKCIIMLFIMLFYTTNTSAFNITRLLNNHPQFGTFNDLLTRTGVANEINKRQTITILVIENSGMGSITSKPESTSKKILETHALLDYYDANKISDLSKDGSIVINFFQNTGTAYREQGQTRITTSGGEVVFASVMKGSPQDSKMVKVVAAQPYNISVIQISQPIVTPGLDQTSPNEPSGSPKATAPTPVATSPPKEADDVEAPTPDVADGPAEDEAAAESPESEAPAAASGPSPSLAPEGEEAADKEAPAKLAPAPKNGASQLTLGNNIVVVWALTGFLALFLD